MNKPKGYVCSAVSDSHKTVYQLLPPEMQRLVSEPKRGERLHTVGRLDCDTTGLLIFTTDGFFSNYMTRAENNIHKVYKVVLKNSVNESEKQLYIQKALKGLLLPAEKKAPEEESLPATIQWENQNTALITVTEGKFHEVKRIFKALGNEVVELKRIVMGNVVLPEDLKEGNFLSFFPNIC